MGLSSPDYIIVVLTHVGFFALIFYLFEGIDFAKFLRKEKRQFAIVIHLLLAIAVAYLVAQFFLTLFFRYYI